MDKHLFNLKFAAKDLERQAKRSEKAEKDEKVKLKKAIQKGNLEGAKIHAENSIRQKNQALNYRRMSARIDAVSARVQTALTTRQVTNSMAGVVKSMEAAMKSMNLEKVSQLMDRFEQQFENLDVQSQVMENTMMNSSTLTTPQHQVDSLMQEVADEAGLELNMDLPSAQASAIGATGSTQASAEQDDLSQRLAKLRQIGILNKELLLTLQCNYCNQHF
ncbi:Charged multivesicular body protein 1b [Bulinus truncatus]|nr:Charged multivesicular body protein 1b [Bulinus truncatus]